MKPLELTVQCASFFSLAVYAAAQTGAPPETIQIPVVIHDISHNHPNFEEPMMGLKKGIVKDQLGVDGLPVWNASIIAKTFTCLTNEGDFNTWWIESPDISRLVKPQEIIAGPCANSKLTLTRNSAGVYTYDSGSFFPLATENLASGAGLPPFPCGANTSKNFHFTMELHNEFTYRPGQVFDFRGDDDVWVFINNKLVVDLGGVHGPAAASVNLDTLGLTAGKIYTLDLFFAERHTTGSNFRMTTDIVFSSDPVLDAQREVENQAPSVALPNDAVIVLGSRSVALSPNVDDDALPRSGGGLNFQWSMENGPGNVGFSTPREQSTQVTFPAEGQYSLRLTAADGEYESFGDIFVSVTPSGIGTITSNCVSDDSHTNARKIWSEAKARLCIGGPALPLDESKRGFNASDYQITTDSEVIITAIHDGSRARNSLCWYDAKSPQNPVTIWHDFAIGPLAPLWVGKKASLGILPAGTELRFALICDGARNKTDMLYMDRSLNRDGSEHIAGRLFDDVDSNERPLVIGWEDVESGPRCDNDFNDVVYQIEIIPVRLSDTQYTDVIPGKVGINSRRGARGVAAAVARQGVAAARYETVAQLFYIPVTAGNYTIDLIDERSSFKTEVRVFDYDAVRGLNPQSLAFRTAAAKASYPLFDERKLVKGGSVTFSPAKFGLRGKTIGLIFVPNNTKPTFLRNPWRYTAKGQNIRTKRQPLFSLINGNPGQIDQLFTFMNSRSTFFCFEDRARYNDGVEIGEASDASFDDLMFKISPKLQPAPNELQGYYIATPDITYGYDPDVDGTPPSNAEECNCYGQ